MDKVWVLLADYGYEGEQIVAIFDHPPSPEEVSLARQVFAGSPEDWYVKEHSVIGGPKELHNQVECEKSPIGKHINTNGVGTFGVYMCRYCHKEMV